MGLFKNFISPDYGEHLDNFGAGILNGRKHYFVTNLDRNYDSHEFLYHNERITINEFNILISRHTASIVSLSGNYHSDECISAIVDFSDQESVVTHPAGGAPRAYSRLKSSNVNDLTMEDGYIIDTYKLYCVSALTNRCEHHPLYWNRQCISLPEINHILASHSARIEQIIPVYRTGTEWFVLICFRDSSLATPDVSYDTLICLTSQNRNSMTRNYFYKYDCITLEEYNKLSRSVTEDRFHINDTGTDHSFTVFAATIRNK